MLVCNEDLAVVVVEALLVVGEVLLVEGEALLVVGLSLEDCSIAYSVSLLGSSWTGWSVCSSVCSS